MNTKSFFKAAAIAIVVGTVSGLPATGFTSSAIAAITVDDKDHDAKAIEIIEAGIEAMGGRDKIESIEHVKTTGTLSIPAAGLKGTIEIYISKPNNMLTVMDLGMMGETLQGVTDGVVWSSDAMGGPRLVPDDEAKDMLEQADPQASLKYADLYTTIKHAGEAEWDGQTANKIVLTDEDGVESTQYYAKESKLLIGTETQAKTPMGDVQVALTFRDYKELGGHLQPTKLVTKMGPQEFMMTFDSAEYKEINAKVYELPPAIKALVEASKEND